MDLRETLLAAAIALSSCTKAEPPRANDAGSPKATTFQRSPPGVGSKRMEASDLDMTVSMTVDGRKSDVTVKESVRHTDEILAVSGDAITKVRTTFDRVEGTQPSAIAGKTYVVESKGDRLEVRDEKGAPAPAGEAKEVEKHMKSLGKPDPMLAALPTAGLVPGAKVDAVAKALGDQLKDSGEATRVDGVVVTFKEQRGDEGVFDVALRLVKDDGALTMTMDVKGEAWVSTKTGATSKMVLAGPLEVRGGAAVKADGAGQMSMRMATHAP